MEASQGSEETDMHGHRDDMGPAINSESQEDALGMLTCLRPANLPQADNLLASICHNLVDHRNLHLQVLSFTVTMFAVCYYPSKSMV